MGILEFAESISSRLSILPIENQLEGEDRSDGREDVLQLFLGHFVGNVADENRSSGFVVQTSGLHLHPWVVHFRKKVFVFFRNYTKLNHKRRNASKKKIVYTASSSSQLSHRAL
jgi:hypothetical protein